MSELLIKSKSKFKILENKVKIMLNMKGKF